MDHALTLAGRLDSGADGQVLGRCLPSSEPAEERMLQPEGRLLHESRPVQVRRAFLPNYSARGYGNGYAPLLCGNTASYCRLIPIPDPQQRQLLECTYEALENAGFPKESIAGRNMGVFIGATASDYRIGTLRDLNQVPMFDATGNHHSIQAGRISYYFDLRGPCFAVDTACSSGLYALHSAVQSIRSGESDSAIVAGCSLHLQPDDMVSMSMLG